MHKGKLVVIEGSDGSGKATQVQLLVNHCKGQQISHASYDFPQYYKTFFGKWVGRFLKGEFGTLEQIPSQLVAFPYAADRWQAKSEMEDALSAGKLVIVNRYVGSNAVYQSAKLPLAKREEFIKWVFEMEYDIFGIPHEDLVIFLYVPLAHAQKLIERKFSRKYLGKQIKDIHEADGNFLEKVEKVYLDFCKKYRHWVKIDCTKNGEILPKDVIHQKILELLQKRKII